MSARWVLALTFFGLLTGPGAAQACSCAGQPELEDALSRADAVFLGEVVEERRSESWPGLAQGYVHGAWSRLSGRPSAYLDEWYGSSRYGRIARFRVEAAFKGAPTAETAIHTGFGGGDCGYPFTAGGRYLVFAHRAKDSFDPDRSFLSTHICTRTVAAHRLSTEIDQLRRLAVDGTIRPLPPSTGPGHFWPAALVGSFVLVGLACLLHDLHRRSQAPTGPS